MRNFVEEFAASSYYTLSFYTWASAQRELDNEITFRQCCINFRAFLRVEEQDLTDRRLQQSYYRIERDLRRVNHGKTLNKLYAESEEAITTGDH